MNNIDFDSEYYKSLCEELKALLSSAKEDEKRIKFLKQEVIQLAGGDRMEYGLEVSLREREAAIDYKALIADLGVGSEVVERYRKTKITFWNVRGY